MNIVYIGFDNECSTKVCNHLSELHTVTLITDRAPTYELDCDVLVSKNLWVNDYFRENPAQLVIYNDIDDNYALLNKWLASGKDTVKHFLIIRQETMVNEMQNAIRLEQMMKTAYAGNQKISVLNVSALYGAETVPAVIENMIADLDKHNTITQPEGLCQICDAIHIDDLCTLLDKLIEQLDIYGNGTLNIQSGYAFHAKDLFEQLGKRYPQAQISLDADGLLHCDRGEATCVEGWSPKHAFMDDLPFVADMVQEKIRQTNSKKRAVKLKGLAKIAVFLAAFLAVELYTNFTSVASDLQYVDLRLGFVAICAVVFGKRYAVAASVFCSAASIVQSLLLGYRWHVIFFNVNNWIPMAVYLVFAMLIGTYADKIRLGKKK